MSYHCYYIYNHKSTLYALVRTWFLSKLNSAYSTQKMDKLLQLIREINYILYFLMVIIRLFPDLGGFYKRGH